MKKPLAPQVAVLLAREHGLRVEGPRVLHDGSSVIILLAPGGPVARVGGLTTAVRDVAAHYAREVAVASWLGDACVPVARPWDPSGPFVRDGHIVTFWHEVPASPLLPGEAAGVALRRCHEKLTAYDGELPPLGSLLEEAARVLDRVHSLCDIALT